MQPGFFSLIIATGHSADRLEQFTAALQVQSYSLTEVEIIQVPRKAGTATSIPLPDTLQRQHLAAPVAGTVAAWNTGAAMAHGQVLLFVQDTVLPTPSWLAAHVAAHQQQAERLVFGPERWPLPRPYGLHKIELRRWYETRYQELRQPGHRYNYYDISPECMSLPRIVWQQIGGFDAHLSLRNAMYDLALRLIDAGKDLYYNEAASVEYTVSASAAPALAWWQGCDDAMLAGRYPHLWSNMPAFSSGGSLLKAGTFLHRLARIHADLGDRVAVRLQGMLGALEQLHLRRHWRTLYRMLTDYWYWRGMTSTLGTTSQPVPASVVTDELECDLAQGIAAVAELLDQRRPAACRLFYQSQPVGRIAPLAGSERLRSRHLYAALTGDLSAPLLAAVAAGSCPDLQTLTNALPFLQHQLIPGGMNAFHNEYICSPD